MGKNGRLFGTLDPFYEGGGVLGRRVANSGFLAALLAADPFAAYHFFCADEAARASLARTLKARHPGLFAAGRLVCRHRLELPAALSRGGYHVFHLSDCLTHQPRLAAARNRFARDIFPITGPIHSLSRTGYPAAFLAHLWPGTTARDAVVCTSTAGRAAVAGFFAGLRRGYGLSPEAFPGPATPLIPLGVDVEANAPPASGERAAARAGLALPEATAMVLVLGRLSHHSKMDLLPVLKAFGRLFAAGLPRGAVRLVLAGWTQPDDDLSATLADLAANMGLDLAIVPRPDGPAKRALLAAADLFCSVPDNPQETFGLTVAEAGACGLPAVVADFDGYRDLVVHEETGLLVPTLGPDQSAEVDALAPLLIDNQYHLLLSQRLAVDVAALAESLLRLITEPELRAHLGRAARARIEARFSWPAVIQAHLDLWDDLWRAPVDEDRARAAVHPLGLCFADVFAAYPTERFDPGMMLAASRAGQAVARGQEFPVIYAGLTGRIEAESLRALCVLCRKPLPADEAAGRLQAALPGLSAEAAQAYVLFALKHDLLERRR